MKPCLPPCLHFQLPSLPCLSLHTVGEMALAISSGPNDLPQICAQLAPSGRLNLSLNVVTLEVPCLPPLLS